MIYVYRHRRRGALEVSSSFVVRNLDPSRADTHTILTDTAVAETRADRMYAYRARVRDPDDDVTERIKKRNRPTAFGPNPSRGLRDLCVRETEIKR